MVKLRVLSGDQGFREFAALIGLAPREREARANALAESYMPFKVTEHYTRLIAAQDEPYRTQLVNVVVPPTGPKPFLGRFDPYGNKTYRQDERAFLQHKYTKTLLLHIDNYCVANCQFCYKVNEIRIEKPPADTIDAKVDMALDYLAAHPEIDNVLFTGGDPAAFRRTRDLVSLISRLIAVPTVRIVRFATKGLAYDPERFLDPELLAFFTETNRRARKQISVIAQINHPAELSGRSAEALAALAGAGVQVRGQPALIRGVNDSVETLVDLQRGFVDNRVIAYYLTVFMPVRGVEQYAIPLHEAFRRAADAKRQLNGLDKKIVLLASHDFGKLEVVGFLPSADAPRSILLKWHQAAKPEYLPDGLKSRVATRPEDLLVLDYDAAGMYCIDHVLAGNGLPHFDPDGRLVE